MIGGISLWLPANEPSERQTGTQAVSANAGQSQKGDLEADVVTVIQALAGIPSWMAVRCP
jgi:hypothetical protein